MSDIPAEVYEAARIAAADTYHQRTGLRPVAVVDHYVHVYSAAAVDAVWPLAEATIRAKIAAEIRAARFIDAIAAPHTTGALVRITDVREWAARIAEGGGA